MKKSLLLFFKRVYGIKLKVIIEKQKDKVLEKHFKENQVTSQERNLFGFIT